jgi:peroxiredoxin
VDKKKRRLILRTAILLVLGGALAFTLYANLTKDKNDSVQVGSKAPDFVLKDMKGQKHKLSDYKGQGVFLNFWGTYCKPCEHEMPYIDSQYKEFKNKGVQVLAVNVSESHYAVQDFIDRHQLTFPVVIDKGGEVQAAYGIDPLPITFLIDKNGRVIDKFTGSLTEANIQQFMDRIKP